jgi:AcrR family transcriptional regulator
VALIGEVGPRAFTLREVARRAGVSHNAPYRHFASKDELLAEVAAEGFEPACCLNAEEHVPCHHTARAAAGVRLRLCGVCPALAAAFPGDVRSASRRLGHEKRRAAGQDAFAVLEECIAAAQSSGDLPAGDPLPLAWTAWSLGHGIAKLAISGNLPLNARSTIEFTRTASQWQSSVA